ncbi:hypothetical protein [Thermopetrobacter sp. TC1]|uniref:hypothetical protein n=1 Tax=Thermopetrobacter sp. TC1 TaxID=1495045 RepID=UPI00056E08A1|nr:hypothetical protein [Thermopetrobacter sp. TC1]
MTTRTITVRCEACGAEAEARIEGIAEIEAALPRRWKRRIINHRAYILCDVCGHPVQFTGGISPYLLDALNLPPNATCEIEEIDDFRGDPDLVTWRRWRRSRSNRGW